MPSLPNELLRLVCLHLSPAPRGLRSETLTFAEHADACEQVKALLAFSACSKGLRELALADVFWERHVLGTWLFGRPTLALETPWVEEYKRRTVKNQRVAALIQELSKVAGEPFTIYESLGQAVGDAPEEVWEELERWGAVEHPGSLGVAYASLLCEQYLLEMHALTLWEHIACLSSWDTERALGHLPAAILRQDKESFADLARKTEQGYAGFSAFDPDGRPSDFLALQMAIDAGVKKVVESVDLSLRGLDEPARLRISLDLAHRVLYDKMNFRLATEDEEELLKGEGKSVTLGYLGGSFRIAQEEEGTIITKKQLALLFSFVSRRLPPDLDFRCLPLSRSSTGDGFVTMCVGTQSEASFSCLFPWTSTSPAILTATEASEKPVFTSSSFQRVRNPVTSTAAVMLAGVNLHEVEADAAPLDEHLAIGASIAQGAILFTSNPAEVAEAVLSAVMGALHSSHQPMRGYHVPVLERLVARVEEEADALAWTPHALELKAEVKDMLSHVRDFRSNFTVRSRTMGREQPLRKLGFVGRGQEGQLLLLVAWDHQDDESVFSTFLEEGVLIDLTETEVAALSPFQDICTPEELADYVSQLSHVEGAYFSHYELDEFIPRKGDKPAQARGLRFIPNPRTLLEYPDDF